MDNNYQDPRRNPNERPSNERDVRSRIRNSFENRANGNRATPNSFSQNQGNGPTQPRNPLLNRGGRNSNGPQSYGAQPNRDESYREEEQEDVGSYRYTASNAAAREVANNAARRNVPFPEVESDDEVIQIPPLQSMQKTPAPAKPKRLRWLWFWLLMPFVVMAVGGWWAYQNVISGLWRFETAAVIRDGNTIVDAVQRVNKQVFVEHYETIDMDYREAPKNWLQYLGVEQSFVVLIRGRIPAGFDLKEIKPENIWVSEDGKKAQLTLPAPKVFEDSVSIDFEKSRIISLSDSCPDVICENSVVAYQNQLLPEAKQMLIDTAEENDILTQTAADGKAYYEQLLRSLGFEEVRVIVTGY